MDVRYFAVEDPENPVGILIVADELISASALHYATRDYEGKDSVYQMGTTDYTILNVDYNKSRGTGGATCGPDTLGQYRLYNDGTDYSYTYTIVPYMTATDDVAELSKLWRDAESFNLDEYNEEKAASVEALIDAIGVVLTYDQLDEIQAARDAYDALTDEVKAKVDNLADLEAAEAEIESVKGARAYIQDKSIYANDAEITGTAAIVKNDEAPSGYAFTGGFSVPDADGRVNRALSGTSKFTVEFWVNPSDLAADNGFFMKGDQQVSVKTTQTGLEAFVYVNGWTPIVDIPFANAGFEANEWNHVALSYDGQTLKLYVDGVLVGTDTVAGTVNSVGYALGIGLNNDPNKANVKLRGQMDGVHVYSTILTDEQVAELAAGTGTAVPADENVVMWYDADQYESIVELTGVTLDKTEAEILVGEELTLTAAVAPENATDKTLTWTSSDEDVAVVENGKVTGIARGETTITVTAANGMSASCVVTVNVPMTEVKDEAIAELEAYRAAMDENLYRAEQIDELDAAVEAGIDAINAANSEEEIAAALAAAKEALDAVKTNEELNKEEMAEAVAAAEAAQAAAEKARDEANAAKAAAEAAKIAADEAAASSAEDKAAAEAARTAAELAQEQSEAAQAAAEKAEAAAKEAAEAAEESNAEAAKEAAASAASAAESAASANAAAASAKAAADAAKAAQEAQAKAEEAAKEAAADREAAEEAAEEAERVSALNLSKTVAVVELNEYTQELMAGASAETIAKLAEAAKAARDTILAAETEEAVAVALENAKSELKIIAEALCAAEEFTDVNPDAWYHEAVDFVLNEGMMHGNGDGTFAPESQLNRAMMVQILYNIEGRPEVTTTKSFSDVTEDTWYYDAVMWAAENGIVEGTSATTYSPKDKLTREQMVTILWRYAGKPETSDAEITFADGADVSQYAKQAVAWAVTNGIVNGVGDNRFDPHGASNRAQIAQIMMNYFKK